jgi:hypothetical protein
MLDLLMTNVQDSLPAAMAGFASTPPTPGAAGFFIQ